jgi:hypothetical protein
LIICISFASIGLLVFSKFHPYSAVFLGIVLSGIIIKFLSLRIEWRPRKIPVALLVILSVALFFRAQPYLFVPGGQDQGTYVNMSAIYEKKGSTFITDDVRNRAVDSGLQKYYDSFNQWSWRNIAKGEYEGEHLPGIYIKNLAQSQYVFQFYPLHPLWMAISGKFLGDHNRVYSLVFFALISIIGFYRLCLEITEGNKTSAALIALFLALNPLHAFFSKFPVTEIVALAFSSLGFFYLVKYYRHALTGSLNPFYLVLSAGLFACMFFTRISGFMYVPFFYLLLIITIVFQGEKALRNNLIIYFISIFILYALSVTYGMNYSYPYSHDIYNEAFAKIFSNSWQTKLGFVVIAAIITLPALWFVKERAANLFSLLKINYNALICGVLFVIVALALYKACLLGYTEKYTGDIALGQRWDMAGHGWKSFRRANVYVAMLYLSPFGFLLFLYHYVCSMRKHTNVIWISLTFFLVMFWYIFAVVKFVTPYHYYYSRYLLSEVVPYSLLGVAILLGSLITAGKRSKLISLVLCAIISIYFGYYTSYQFAGKSAEGSYDALKDIKAHVDETDLLLIYKEDFEYFYIFNIPLSLYFDLNVCRFEKISDLTGILKKNFLSKYDDIFILSNKSLDFPFLHPLREIQYKEGFFKKKKNKIPRKFRYWRFNLHLYKFDKDNT